MCEKQWVHVGPKVPLREPDRPFNVYLLQRIRSFGERILLINGETDEKVTGAQLLSRSVGVALQLRERGVRPGDVVTASLDNCFESSYSLLGILFVGAVFVPFNLDLDVDDTRNLFDVLDPRLVMCAPRSVAKTTSAVKPGTPVITVQDDNPEWEAFVNPSASAVATFKEYTGAKLDDTLCIVCSSGTTGPPKGAMFSHRLWHYLAQIVEMFWNVYSPEGLKSEIFLKMSPNYWITALTMQIMNTLIGQPIVFYKTFNPMIFLKAVEKYKITFVIVTPPQVAAIIKLPDVEKYDVSSIKVFICGGAPLSPELSVLGEKRLKKKLTEGYALTECLYSIIPHPNTPRGSIGKVSANVKAKIVDIETGKTVGPNTEGEIWIKSKLSFSGYYNDTKSTADILDERNWIHTGDVARFDENGNFYLLDRYKDLIRCRGVHVAPTVVEGILTVQKEVKDAAVVGIEHEEYLEQQVAFVVLQDGHSISEEELRCRINEPLPLYKQLTALYFIDEIPRTKTDKIQRRQLRQRARELVKRT